MKTVRSLVRTGLLGSASVPAWELIIVILAGCAGVGFVHRVTVMSGFDMVQADIGDSRLIVFLLDHWRRVFAGIRGWSSPGMFYPLAGTLGYSDMLLGMGLPYALFRSLGLGLFESANAVVVLLALLSYFSCYWLLRKIVRAGVAASLMGALFFALGYPKFSQLGHLQLSFDFFQPLALGLIAPLWLEDRWFSPGEIAVRTNAFVALAGLGAMTTFYHAWFFLFWLALTAVATAGFTTLRTRALERWRQGWTVLWQPLLAGALLLVPFLSLYVPGRSTGFGRDWQTTAGYIPSLWDYGRVGSQHLLWGWTGLNAAPSDIEKRLGIGVLASLVLLGGWGWSIFHGAGSFRRGEGPAELGKDLLAAALLSSLLITGLTIHWGAFYPWRAVYLLVPGAAAMLATGRWVLTLMLPASILLSVVIDVSLRRSSRHRLAVAGTLAVVSLLLLAEQVGRSEGQYSATVATRYHEKIVDLIPDSCEAFLLAPGLPQGIISRDQFDERKYLAANPDVARNWHGSAWEHYRLYGFHEGRQAFRRPPDGKSVEPGMISREQFDEQKYLAANPDVARNWRGSAWEHYRQYGFREGRSMEPGDLAFKAFEGFHYQVSAMIASALSGKPTVNGASGLLPAGYPLSNLFHQDLERQLADWFRKYPDKRACLIRTALVPDQLLASR